MKAELFRKQEEFKRQKLTSQNASFIKGKSSTAEKKVNLMSTLPFTMSKWKLVEAASSVGPHEVAHNLYKSTAICKAVLYYWAFLSFPKQSRRSRSVL